MLTKKWAEKALFPTAPNIPLDSRLTPTLRTSGNTSPSDTRARPSIRQVKLTTPNFKKGNSYSPELAPFAVFLCANS